MAVIQLPSLPSAATAASGDLMHLRQGTTDKKMTTDVLKTFMIAGNGAGSGLDADLLDGQHGSFYRNASNLNAGTVPSARLPTASEGGTGGAELATQAEVLAGIITDKIVTPATLAGLGATFSQTSGFQKLPGGLIIQWGRLSTSGDLLGGNVVNTFTLPIAFPTAFMTGWPTLFSGTQGSNTDLQFCFPRGLTAFSTTSITVGYDEREGVVQDVFRGFVVLGH